MVTGLTKPLQNHENRGGPFLGVWVDFDPSPLEMCLPIYTVARAREPITRENGPFWAYFDPHLDQIWGGFGTPFWTVRRSYQGKG